MKIIGIDPGFSTLGFAQLDSTGTQLEKLLFLKTQKETKKRLKGVRIADDDARRIGEIVKFLLKNFPRVMHNGKPSINKSEFIVGIEAYSPRPGMGGGIKATLGYAAVIATLALLNKELFIFTAGDVKKGLCGKMSASKKEIQDVVFERFGVDPNEKDGGRPKWAKYKLEHIGDALALATLAKKEQEKIEKILGRR